MVIQVNKLLLEEKKLPSNWMMSDYGEEEITFKSDLGHIRTVTYQEIMEYTNQNPEEEADEEGNISIDDGVAMEVLMEKLKDDPELNTRFTGNTTKKRYTFDTRYLRDIEEYDQLDDGTQLDTSATKITFIDRDSLLVDKDHDELLDTWKWSLKSDELGLE